MQCESDADETPMFLLCYYTSHKFVVVQRRPFTITD
ncbi:hypothetical protein MNNICLKF_00769 [Synechococcus sp. CBW1107]|nr:hypothetical protein MNNICLKF_00769 [Synechococcus sp. CBW1107]